MLEDPPPLSSPLLPPQSTTTPTVHLFLLSSPRHPCILKEKPQTSFLLRQFVFPNANTRPFTISACFALPKPSEQRSPNQCFYFKKNVVFPPPLPHPTSQTPSGLLLAHSPLLSGIHFWSSLSPVAPLSPARLQGHSSLFQVRNTHRWRRIEEERGTKIAGDEN